ncbi:hypothetical protein KIH23_13605, partial [Flavobacterium sp. CYK-55]|nr:hypothetical protein [Flavobacterium sp. CYK-55]
MQLTFPTGGAGITLNICVVYCQANTNSAAISFANGNLVLGGPYTASGVTCATSGAVSNLGAVTCFGGNNGSATVTMSPVPSNSSITYTVDGGASTAATLESGAFNVSGLTAGEHTIAVSNGSCAVVNVPVTISGPASALTNTTTESACGSFTWGVTGLTYSESGTY